jgi:hypothetical protein
VPTGENGDFLFFFYQLPSFLRGFGHELGAALNQFLVLKFLPICGVQEVQLDQSLTLNGSEILLKLFEHLLNFPVGFFPFFLFFGPRPAVAETQGHGSSDESSANRSETGDAPSERGRHFRRLIFVKIQILPEDLDYRLRSIQAGFH